MTSDDDGTVGAATRVVLRPFATPMPLGFLALSLATVIFSAVELGWIAPTQGQVAGLVAVAATAPLQLTASVFGFLTRDPVAATGMAILSGTWALVGLTTLMSPPGTTSPGLGVLLITSAIATMVPASAGSAKLVPAGVMVLTGIRFALTGVYQLTGSGGWQTTAGAFGLVVGVAAVYAALALELEGAHRRTVLPLGRRGLAESAVRGEAVFDAAELAREPGVRPRL